LSLLQYQYSCRLGLLPFLLLLLLLTSASSTLLLPLL